MQATRYDRSPTTALIPLSGKMVDYFRHEKIKPIEPTDEFGLVCMIDRHDVKEFHIFADDELNAILHNKCMKEVHWDFMFATSNVSND